MTTLFVNACMRGEDSRTLALCREYLQGKEDVVEVDLAALGLKPFDAQMVAYRTEKQKAKAWDDPIFDLSHQFAEADEIPSVEVLFSVPKKFHKRANKRNLLRRRTKEAYRLQKQTLKNGSPANLDLALIYSSKEVLPYKTIQNAVRRILETVVEHL